MRIRKQFTTTLEPSLLDELRAKSESTRVPIGVLIEDAWATYKGTPTPLTLARRQMLFGDAASAPVKRAA